MAHGAIPHDRKRIKIRVMTVQASIGGLRDAVVVAIRVRDKRAIRNRSVVKQMVPVRNPCGVTRPAVVLRLLAIQDVRHTEGLVDWGGGYRGPIVTNKNQRQAGDDGENDRCSVHFLTAQ